MSAKVLFVCVNLNQGGIRHSLLNILKSTTQNDIEYSIQVLTDRESDRSFVKYIKDEVPNVKICDRSFFYNSYYRSLKEIIKQKLFAQGLVKVFFVLYRKICGSYNTLRLISRLTQYNSKIHYDVAISFDNDIWDSNGGFSGGANRFVLEHINAKKKIGWIHAEPSYYGLTHERAIEEYRLFDVIVNVSYACKAKFDAIVPEYSYKSKVVYNGFDEEYIKSKAKLECNIKFTNVLNIITVSRVTYKAKRSDRIIKIAQKLVDAGIDFRWIVVGDGDLRKILEEQAITQNLPIVFLGNIDEPYNYIMRSDIFVLPSEQESFGMVLAESLICGTPVICTDFAASREVVCDGKNGIITENSEEALYKAICMFSNDKGKMKDTCDYKNSFLEQYFEVLGE